MTPDALNAVLTGRIVEQFHDTNGASAPGSAGAAASPYVEGGTGGTTPAPGFTPATILSFSPAANAVLSGAEAVLTVISASQSPAPPPPPATTPARHPSTPVPVTAAPAPLPQSSVSAQANTDEANPAAIAHQVVGRQEQLAPPPPPPSATPASTPATLTA